MECVDNECGISPNGGQDEHIQPMVVCAVRGGAQRHARGRPEVIETVNGIAAMRETTTSRASDIGSEAASCAFRCIPRACSTNG